MKSLKTTCSLLLFTMLILTVSSCKNEPKVIEVKTFENSISKEENHSESELVERNISPTTQKNKATSEIIVSYLQIKDALVADDKDGAAKAASMMLTAFSTFDVSQLNDAQQKEYLEILESAKEQAEHISESPIHHQREHFDTLSTDIADLIALLGTNKTLYQDYCPMAKASWLSETKDIKNPYYGNKMLKCGNVQKQIN